MNFDEKNGLNFDFDTPLEEIETVTVSTDEDDAFELEKYNRLFSKPYFDLPSYMNGNNAGESDNLLDRTGIPLLEKMIMSNFKIIYL